MSDQKLSPEPSMDEILASIRRIIAEDEHVIARPLQRLRGNGDVLDLTEAIADDGTVRHIAPIAFAAPETPPALPDGRVEPVAPRPEGFATEPRLVSDAASDAVAASFARLANSGRDQNEPPLEDVVREALRPMLQAWLDENLPALVERLVKAEIARVVGARPAAP